MTTSYPKLDFNEIKERKAFLEWTEQDVHLLHHHRKLFTRAACKILDGFYAHLSTFPELKSLLSEGGVLAHLRQVQRRYWQRMFSGRYDADYVQDRLRIGLAHQRVGLKPKWYIGSYAWFLNRLLETVCHAQTLAWNEKSAVLKSLVKIVFFDLSLAIETYVEADRLALERLKTHLERIVDTVPEALLTLDATGSLLAANPAAKRLFERSWANLKITSLSQLLADERGQPLSLHRLLEHLWCPGAPPLSALARQESDRQVPVEITLSSLPYEEPPCYLAVIRDVSRQKQTEAKLRQLAQFDPLTGLPNRALFLDRLAQALARSHRYQTQVAVLFLDLDDFKKINDSFGHLVGDQLLKQAALRLKSVLRETDTLARLGGDEFALCLPDLHHPEGYQPIAAKLSAAFTPSFRLESQEVFVKASIGIALFPHHGSDPHTLLKHADAAMYEAKHKRLGYCCYNAALEHAATHRITLESELHRALEREEFYLVFQPQVELASGRIVGLEALLRWRSQALGEVSPAGFIPYLEHTGLIHPVGEWVLRTACLQVVQMQKAHGLELALAVNCSARQIAQPDFPERLYQMLCAVGFPPKQLELEITENTLMERNEATIGNLETLRAMGVRLAIDDFGIGYSSLGYLKSFSFHTLKIDRSFIQQLHSDKDMQLARHIVGIGKSLELTVVAEGIETEEQLATVQALGCDLVQGYYFSPPIEIQALSALLTHTFAANHQA